MASLFRLPAYIRNATIVFSLPQQSRPLLHVLHSRKIATSASSGRTYADAVALLDSLQSNRSVVSSINTSWDMNLDAIPEMLEWTKKAGYVPQDFTKRGLRCIHVAGTKGKGSTCVMIENLLLQYRKAGKRAAKKDKEKVLGKIGLYTSPHLVTVRERIRIDGHAISESLFTRYFFEIWDRFSEAARMDAYPSPESSETKPGYFRYLTIMTFHTFLEEGVESAVIECGIGGQYDSTNILPGEAVTVCAITRLGIDHTEMLGETIRDIAWHKAGIMKVGVPVFSVEQEVEGYEVLQQKAAEIGADLSVVERLPLLENEEIKLGLDGEFQKDNASLAIAVAATHLRRLKTIEGIPPPTSILKAEEPIPSKFINGLETSKWQGRWQTIQDGKIQWLVDGSHTADSLRATAEWYNDKHTSAMDSLNKPTATFLIFNQQDRDAQSLFKVFMMGLQQKKLLPQTSPVFPVSRVYRIDSNHRFPRPIFTYAAFCRNEPFKLSKEGPGEEEGERDLTVQQDIAKLYQRMDGNSLNMSYGSVEEAVELARRVSADEGDRLLVLVTGSLHLVGGLLKVLDHQGVVLDDGG